MNWPTGLGKRSPGRRAISVARTMPILKPYSGWPPCLGTACMRFSTSHRIPTSNSFLNAIAPYQSKLGRRCVCCWSPGTCRRHCRRRSDDLPTGGPYVVGESQILLDGVVILGRNPHAKSPPREHVSPAFNARRKTKATRYCEYDGMTMVYRLFLCSETRFYGSGSRTNTNSAYCRHLVKAAQV